MREWVTAVPLTPAHSRREVGGRLAVVEVCVCVCVCKRFRLRTPVWGEEETAAEERCTRKNKTYMYVTVRKATGSGERSIRRS